MGKSRFKSARTAGARKEPVGAREKPAEPIAELKVPIWLKVAGIVLLVVAAYQPVVRAGFIWDDDDYVTKNTTLRDTAGLMRTWTDRHANPQYYPLVHTTFWIEYHLWGLRPLGYHLVNVGLHTVNALLLWALLHRLSVPGAWWAAALFAVHPVMVESVAWITERKNVLSTFFYLVSFLALLRSWPPEEERPSLAGRWLFYGLAVTAFALALFSKTVACSLPAAFLLVRWWSRGWLTWRDGLATLPFFAVGLALALNTAFLEKQHVGAEGKEWDLPWLDRVLIAGRAAWFYAGKLVWPETLTFIYPRWVIDPNDLAQAAYPVAAVLLLVALWTFRTRIGRGPLTAALFFVGTLVPALGFFDVYPMRYSFVADHFQYLASLGLFALAGAVCARALASCPTQGRIAGYAAGGVAVVVLVFLSRQQIAVYENLMTLWTDTVTKNTACWMAYNNRADVYIKQGQIQLALADADRAVALNPDCWETHATRGGVHFKIGAWSTALADLNRAIEIKPDAVPAILDRGTAYQKLGQLEKAIADYSRVIDILPTDGLAYINRGVARQQAGELDRAIEDLTRGIEIRPDDAEAYYNRGLCYHHLNKHDLAIRDYGLAVEKDPHHWKAYDNRGSAHFQMGQYEQSLADYSRAIDLHPNAAGIRFNRAALYLDLKRYQDAWSDLRRGQELGGEPNPDLVRELTRAFGGPDR